MRVDRNRLYYRYSRGARLLFSFIFGWEDKGLANPLVYIPFVLQVPSFWGFYAWLLIGAEGQKMLIDR